LSQDLWPSPPKKGLNLAVQVRSKTEVGAHYNNFAVPEHQQFISPNRPVKKKGGEKTGNFGKN